MRGKLWFLGGVAAGFVLGARAGREKYDELVANTRKMWDHPTMQEAAGVVQAQANRLYSESKGTVTDKLSRTKLGERFGNRSPENGELSGSRIDSSEESAQDTENKPSNSDATF